ncbi:MAG: glycosyl hydrolase family 28-related protein [Planctomycetota bacterium]|nr:glycosyl hydrolase family 28-related protein [Planctomycetota bacterium]
MTRTIAVGWLVLAALAIAGTVRGAEAVTLEVPGGSVRGTVVEIGAKEIVLKEGDTERRIPLAFLKPRDLYACRRALLDLKDSKTVLELADYCLKQNLNKEAEDLLESAFKADPDAYRAKYQEIVKKNVAVAQEEKAAAKAAVPAPQPAEKKAAGRPLAPANEEEFLGPFASWADAKKDYGAVGDGKADDTAALQKALDDLHQEKRVKSVLYIPAGTYRLTSTIKMMREKHNEGLGAGIYGEDPEKTILLWDGPKDGVMFQYNPWYARLGRLTFDGAGKAKTAIQHGPEFVTANEISDLIVRDVAFGIEAGMKAGIAETTVIRCRFQRCSKAAASIQNWNSLDWFFWQCHFEDCNLGVTNQFSAGNFHVYDSVFRNSTTADISIGNTMYFSFRRNYSAGSKAFFVAGGIGAGCPTTIEANTIIDAKGTAIQVGNLGPVMLLDNTIVSDKPGAVVKFADQTAALSAGNTFAIGTGKAVVPGKRFHALDDKAGPAQVPSPPPLVFAPHPQRQVIEIPPGANAQKIQAAIQQAAALAGQRVVIHLPSGSYGINQTLVIPEHCDVQLAGDGKQNATSLGWSGQGPGPIIRIAGNSRATIRDMGINAGKQADAIVIAGDPPDSRVITRQVWAGNSDACFLFDHLARSNVYLQDSGHSGSRVGVKAIGAGAEGMDTRPNGRVFFLSGATSDNELSYDISNGAWLLVRDIWYESGSKPRFMNCTDSGIFTLHGAQIAYPRKADAPGVLIENFKGKLCFIGANFTTVSKDEATPAVVVKGESKDAKVLLLQTHGHGEYLKNESPSARVARLEGICYTPGGGGKIIADVGTWDPQFAAEMLAQTRGQRLPCQAPLPAEAGDVRLYRLCVSGRNALTVTAAEK